MDKAGEIVDGRGTYQIKKLRAALLHVKQFRAAIDVGAHCGLWSMHLVKRFGKINAFEPVAAHRECFALNVQAANATLHGCALGDKNGMVSIHTAATSSGDSWVDGAGDIPIRRLDDFELQDVDFIKIDTEGHELFVLRGGEETIRRCKPCLIVEQKPGHGHRFGIGDTDAIPLLESWGAKRREVLSGDFIYSWD